MKTKLISLVCASVMSLSMAYAANTNTQVTTATASAPVELLYTQMANSASVKLNQNQQSATLTLNNVNNKTTWFSDRPVRESGVVGTKHFVSQWQTGGSKSFQTDPPNANIVALRSSNAHLQANPKSLGSFELSNPTYNAKTKTLSYTIKSISGKLKNINHLNDVVLFIDSQIPMFGCTPSGKGC